MMSCSSPSPEVFRNETGTCFTIERRNGNTVTAVLHTVDPPAEKGTDDTQMNLYFDVSGPLESGGLYRVRHPRLGTFRARFRRVQAGGREPTQTGYRAVPVKCSQHA